MNLSTIDISKLNIIITKSKFLFKYIFSEVKTINNEHIKIYTSFHFLPTRQILFLKTIKYVDGYTKFCSENHTIKHYSIIYKKLSGTKEGLDEMIKNENILVQI